MVSKSREIGIRLSLKDKERVERGLQSLGKEGQAALRGIERAGKPASTSLLALNAAAGSARTGVGHFFGGISGSILPVLTFGAAIHGAKAALDKFGDIADRSVESGLDVEFFQGLAHQAKLAGVEFEGFSGAMTTFAKNAGLAAEGKGRMVTQLKELNPELLKSIQLARSQEERVRLAADAINSTADAADKAALATALFGESGIAMAKAFDGGAVALDKSINKARELGLVVDRDTISKAEELGDKFDTVAQIIDLKLKSALVNLGPTLVWLLDLANAAIDRVDTAFQAGNPLRQQSTRALEDQLDELRTLAAKAKDNPITIGRYFENSGGAERLREIEKELFRRADQKSVEELNMVPPGSTPLPDLPISEEAKKSINDAKALIQRLRNEVEIYADTMTDLQKKLDAGLITQETFNRGQAEAALKFAKAADDAEEYVLALDRIEHAHRQGLITQKQYTDAVESLTKRRLIAQNDWAAGIQLGLNQIKEGAKDVATDVASAVTGWADQLGEQIGEAARTGKFAWQDLVRSMLADLAKLATQQLITRPLAGLLSSVTGSLFGGGGYLGNGIGPGGSFGQLSAFRIGNNADGTDNWRGGPTWVGERGPEIVNLPRGAQVIPNHKLGAVSVTLAPVYHVNGSGLSQGQLAAVLEANNASLLAQVPEAVKAAQAKGKFG